MTEIDDGKQSREEIMEKAYKKIANEANQEELKQRIHEAYSVAKGMIG